MTFDRGCLTAEYSLNRVLLPARGYPPAGTLLSRTALVRRIREGIGFAGTDNVLLVSPAEDLRCPVAAGSRSPGPGGVQRVERPYALDQCHSRDARALARSRDRVRHVASSRAQLDRRAAMSDHRGAG